MKSHDPILVAQYLLGAAKGKGLRLNVTQVQKLMYLSYGIGLSKLGTELIEELPKAWPYGPVFPKAQSKVDYTKQYDISEACFADIINDAQAKYILDYTLDKFGKISASKLSNWSHKEGGPWDKATKQPNFKWNQALEPSDIRDYFSQFEFDGFDLQA